MVSEGVLSWSHPLGLKKCSWAVRYACLSCLLAFIIFLHHCKTMLYDTDDSVSLYQCNCRSSGKRPKQQANLARPRRHLAPEFSPPSNAFQDDKLTLLKYPNCYDGPSPFQWHSTNHRSMVWDLSQPSESKVSSRWRPFDPTTLWLESSLQAPFEERVASEAE